MKAVGTGAMEIRIYREGEWRIIYVAKIENAVYVLHAFEKKSQKTRQADIELAHARCKEVEAYEKSETKRVVATSFWTSASTLPERRYWRCVPS